MLSDAVFDSNSHGLPWGYFVLLTVDFSNDLAAANENLEWFLEHKFDAKR